MVFCNYWRQSRSASIILPRIIISKTVWGTLALGDTGTTLYSIGTTTYGYYDSGRASTIEHINAKADNSADAVQVRYAFDYLGGRLSEFSVARPVVDPGPNSDTGFEQTFGYDSNGQVNQIDNQFLPKFIYVNGNWVEKEDRYGDNGNLDASGYDTGSDNRLNEDPRYHIATGAGTSAPCSPAPGQGTITQATCFSWRSVKVLAVGAGLEEVGLLDGEVHCGGVAWFEGGGLGADKDALAAG